VKPEAVQTWYVEPGFTVAALVVTVCVPQPAHCAVVVEPHVR